MDWQRGLKTESPCLVFYKDQARGFFISSRKNVQLEEYTVKGNRFVFKHYLLKGASAALLSCGGALLLPAQTTVATLDEVVITASRNEESRREITSNVTVITEEDIKASTASTLADLMVENGLQVFTTGDMSNVYIRGYGQGSMASESENMVLTLVNGRRIGNANLALVGLSNVKQVEIIRGPGAVQYGPAALGGVINVITKQGLGAYTPYISVEAGIGSDALRRQKISFGGAGGGFDFALGLTNYGRDDVTTSGGQRWYNTKTDRNTVFNADLGYTIADKHRAGVNFNFGGINSTLPRSGFRENNTPDSPFSNYTKNNRNIALSYAGHSNDAFDWSANYSFGRDDRKYPSSAAPYTNKVENQTFSAQTGYTAGIFSLSVGVDHIKYNTLKDERATSTENTKANSGVFFTGKLRLFDERLIFSAGGRYDAYATKGGALPEMSYGNFSPSIGLAYLPVEWLKLRAKYAQGFRLPSTGQMSGNSTNTAPNPDLNPEKSKTVEFGSDINWNFIDMALTYFHSDWADRIMTVSFPAGVLPEPFTRQNQNAASTTLAGLEGSFRMDIGKAFGRDYGLTPFTDFTWNSTRRNNDESLFITFNGERTNILRYTPDWMVSYGVDYRNPALKLKTRLNASRYGETLQQNFSLSGSPYFLRTPGTVVNLSAERELAQFGDGGGTVSLRAEINNLFDGKNEIYFDYPGAGRSFYLGLRYDF